MAAQSSDISRRPASAASMRMLHPKLAIVLHHRGFVFPLLFPSSNLQSSWMNRNKLSLLFVDEEVVWLTSRPSTQSFSAQLLNKPRLIKLSQTSYIHPCWPRFTDFLIKYVLKIHHYICGYHLK
jgi:hypothetical protein